MAKRKVTLTKEEEDALQGGNFFKFTAIGQTLIGRYLRPVKQTGTYAKADRSDYVFKTVDAETKQPIEVVVNGSKLLDALMKKTIAEGLKPGNAVWLKLVENIDIGKENPMQRFELEWDDAPPKQAAPPPPPPPAASAADDIPF
jgi:hypothetical protein